MHVLHIINNLAVGGAERFLLSLTARQARLGCKVDVVTLVEDNPLAGALSDGIDYTCLKRRRLNDPRLLVDVFALLQRLHPDVVHTHLFYADFFGRLGARWAGVPALVSTEHSTEGGTLSAKRRVGMRLTANFPQRIVAVSTAARERMAARLGLEPARIAVIPNGIDVGALGEATPLARSSLGVPDAVPLVGAVGRLVASKAYDDLLRAVARLDDARVQVLMVGDGPERAALESLAAELGIGARVHWTGMRDDVARILKTIDVFVLPSLWEGHSVALLEAMAAGCACVVSDVPELTETLGDAGVIVPVHDVDALATALRDLLVARDLRRRFQEQARHAAAPYSIERSAQRYVSLYNEILRK